MNLDKFQINSFCADKGAGIAVDGLPEQYSLTIDIEVFLGINHVGYFKACQSRDIEGKLQRKVIDVNVAFSEYSRIFADATFRFDEVLYEKHLAGVDVLMVAPAGLIDVPDHTRSKFSVTLTHPEFELYSHAVNYHITTTNAKSGKMKS